MTRPRLFRFLLMRNVYTEDFRKILLQFTVTGVTGVTGGGFNEGS